MVEGKDGEKMNWMEAKIKELDDRLVELQKRLDRLERTARRYGSHDYSNADTTAIPQFAVRKMEEMEEKKTGPDS